MNFKEHDRELASLFKKGSIAKALEAAASSGTTSSVWKIVGNVKKLGKERIGLTLSTSSNSSSREGKGGGLTIESDIRPAVIPNMSLKMAITEQMRLKKFNASYESSTKYGLLAVYFSLPRSVDLISSLSSKSKHPTDKHLSHSNDTNAPKISPAAVIPTTKTVVEVINYFLTNSEITHSKSVGRIVSDTILCPPSMNTNNRGSAVSGGLFESILSYKISETAMVSARVQVSVFAEALRKEADDEDYSSAVMNQCALSRPTDNGDCTPPAILIGAHHSDAAANSEESEHEEERIAATRNENEENLLSGELALAAPSRTISTMSIPSTACTPVNESNAALREEEKERKKNDKTRGESSKKDKKKDQKDNNASVVANEELSLEAKEGNRIPTHTSPSETTESPNHKMCGFGDEKGKSKRKSGYNGDEKIEAGKEKVGCRNVPILAIELRARYGVPQKPGTNHCFSFVKKSTFCKPLPAICSSTLHNATHPQDGCQKDDAVHETTMPPLLARATSDGREGTNGSSHSEKTKKKDKTTNGTLPVSVWRRTTTLAFTDLVASGRLLFSHTINSNSSATLPSHAHAHIDAAPRMLLVFGLFGALKISVKERPSSSNSSSLLHVNHHEVRANDECGSEGHRRGDKKYPKLYWERGEGKSLFRDLFNDRTINIGARISCDFNTKHSSLEKKRILSPSTLSSSSSLHPPARSPTFTSRLVDRTISPHKHVNSLMKFTVVIDTPCFFKKKNTVRFGLESSISASLTTCTKEGLRTDACVDGRQRKTLLSSFSSSFSAFAPALVFGYTYANKGTVVDLTIDHRGKMGLYATFNSE